MSDASSAACADPPPAVCAVVVKRCARCWSFWLAIARTCGMSAVEASVIRRSITTRCTARAISASYGFDAVGGKRRRHELVDDGLEARQRRVERVLFHEPRGSRIIEEITDRQVGGDDGGRDRVEHLAGVAREELARVAIARRVEAESCRAAREAAPARTVRA